MYEYRDLIKKEKREALLGYDENAFRLELDRKIAEASRPTLPYLRWFQRPAIAGSALLLILLFGWLSTKIFLPLTQESDEIILKNTFAQFISQHGMLMSQRMKPVEQGMDISTAAEFEWTIKRLLYAIQREKNQGVDISESLSRVLQKTAPRIEAEKDINGEKNI